MAHNTDKVLIAIKKSKSLIEKIIKMLNDGNYCIDIIQQNLAIIGLLKAANLTLLEGHINHCVKDAVLQKNSKRLDEMMKELLKVINIAQKK